MADPKKFPTPQLTQAGLLWNQLLSRKRGKDRLALVFGEGVPDELKELRRGLTPEATALRKQQHKLAAEVLRAWADGLDGEMNE